MVGTGRFSTAELLVLCTRPLAKRLFGDSATLRRLNLGCFVDRQFKRTSVSSG